MTYHYQWLTLLQYESQINSNERATFGLLPVHGP